MNYLDRYITTCRTRTLRSWLIFVLVMAGIFYYLFGGFIANLSWSPPPQSTWQTASGQFLPQTACDTPQFRCDAPFTFRTDDGRTLSVNCEPAPALNDCLYDEAHRTTNAGIASKPATITYFNAQPQGATQPFLVVMAATVDGRVLFDAPRRIALVRGTQVGRSRTRGPVRSQGHGFTLVMMSIFAVWALVMGVIPLLIRLFAPPVAKLPAGARTAERAAT